MKMFFATSLRIVWVCGVFSFLACGVEVEERFTPTSSVTNNSADQQNRTSDNAEAGGFKKPFPTKTTQPQDPDDSVGGVTEIQQASVDWDGISQLGDGNFGIYAID